jgi:hypothetical protein
MAYNKRNPVIDANLIITRELTLAREPMVPTHEGKNIQYVVYLSYDIWKVNNNDLNADAIQ